MADAKTSWTKRDGRYVPTHTGTEFGKDAEYDEAQDKRRRQEYDQEQGWAGLGNASKRPKGAQYEEGYQTWLAKKYPKPKPKPTPTPAVSADEAADELEKRKP